MKPHGAAKHRHGTAIFAFAFALFSCVAGLSFCLVKSPQARAQAYLATAIKAMETQENERAALAALEAVRLDPMQPHGWRILSEMLHRKGEESAAVQARVIADRVQQNPVSIPPVYAMPAEFKLSLLALSETQIP